VEKEVADLVGAEVKRGGGRKALSCAAFEKEVADLVEAEVKRGGGREALSCAVF
jgi:hypothetical protein